MPGQGTPGEYYLDMAIHEVFGNTVSLATLSGVMYDQGPVVARQLSFSKSLLTCRRQPRTRAVLFAMMGAKRLGCAVPI